MDELRARGDLSTGSLFASGAELPPDAALDKLQRRPGEGDRDFVHRAVDILHRSLAHVHDPAKTTQHRWHVPARENVFLWLAGYVSPRVRKYAFCSHERAIRRGVGLCGQQARALVSALRDGGVEAKPVALEGHVIVEAIVDGEPWILDSDFNVVIEQSLTDCQAHPDVVREAYREQATPLRGDTRLSQRKVDEVVAIYSTSPSSLSPPLATQMPVERALYAMHAAFPWVVLATILYLASKTSVHVGSP